MSKVLIIAEAGVNHNGDIEIAKRLIDAAADAKADFVKFQTFKADNLVSKTAKMASYQIKNLDNTEASQYNMLKKLEMPEDWHVELKEYCKDKGIEFMSTGFDEESIDLLDRLGCSMFKIPSGEITNKPYLQHVAKKGKKIILSTGMADMEEIRQAITLIKSEGVTAGQITVLHCNTEYPTPMSDVNLLAMNVIKNELDIAIGYSDHTLGIEVPIAAVALGAEIIEKHFTVDRSMPGPDHKASLEPDELAAMVKAIRNIEQAISGTGLKTPSISETANKAIARRSIHISNDIGVGHVILKGDLKMQRPGDGISPMLIDEVIGRSSNKALLKDYKLTFKDLD